MIRVVFNQKGGVGKTSITCNLAAISAALGYRTLVVDLDVQGNTTHYLVGAIDGDAFPAEALGVAGLFKVVICHQRAAAVVGKQFFQKRAVVAMTDDMAAGYAHSAGAICGI